MSLADGVQDLQRCTAVEQSLIRLSPKFFTQNRTWPRSQDVTPMVYFFKELVCVVDMCVGGSGRNLNEGWREGEKSSLGNCSLCVLCSFLL